jgi:hypothetical protein
VGGDDGQFVYERNAALAAVPFVLGTAGVYVSIVNHFADSGLYTLAKIA